MNLTDFRENLTSDFVEYIDKLYNLELLGLNIYLLRLKVRPIIAENYDSWWVS